MVYHPQSHLLYDPDAINKDQVSSDLDALLTNLDAGWQPLGLGHHKYVVGDGGCILTAMNRSLTLNCIPPSTARDVRLYAMMGAMGFLTGENDKGLPPNMVSTGDMYHWNDAQTDVDVVKARVKDAINNL
jgi:hypothetical protein